MPLNVSTAYINVLLTFYSTLCCSESAELAEVEAHLEAEDKRDDDATGKSQKVWTLHRSNASEYDRKLSFCGFVTHPA